MVLGICQRSSCLANVSRHGYGMILAQECETPAWGSRPMSRQDPRPVADLGQRPLPYPPDT
jgi:hypothetical protein